MKLKDGEPCGHTGCLYHVTHPCEGCGRIAGRTVKDINMIDRNKLLEKTIAQLREIPSFIGSIPDQYFTAPYMTDGHVIQELSKRFSTFTEMKSIKGCGELTRNEKKEIVILKKYFEMGD